MYESFETLRDTGT